ncbi:MAG: prepilin-type N-terminal cleavage/methylation domain-containing protein [Bryobacterales bacterium]|nr:prepilin-type N-terminal cleavage/methylation domain-containing protein [Bryobacterales bacterium]
MRNRSRRGLTLVEVLIAVTLVSLLSTGILYAMSLGFKAMETTNRRFTDNRRALGSLRLLENQFAAMIPAQVPCAGVRTSAGTAPLYFQGAPNSLQFVTAYTLEDAARGIPRIVDYLVLPGDAQVGGVRLVMQEMPYVGAGSLAPLCAGPGTDPMHRAPTAMLHPPRLGPRAFVLADQLAYCRIFYQRVHPVNRQASWEPTYNGAVFPAAIRIEMAPLRPDPSRVQVTTATIPVRVSRNTFEIYADIEPEQQQ